MNSEELGNYYLSHQHEFLGELGHQTLLVGLKQFVKPVLDNTLVIGVDVGCCVGDYITNITDICSEPNAEVLCFEPNPANIGALESRIKSRPNVRLFPHCLSNETSRTAFYNWSESNGNFTGNEIGGLRCSGEKICDVDVKRLDDVLRETYEYSGPLTIKFLKIDTEGNDGNVLKGCRAHLPYTKYIIFECSDALDDCRGPNIENPMKDIVDFLSEYGFDTYRIGAHKMFKVNDEYWNPVYDRVKFWSNCFALKKSDPLINDLVDANFDYKF
jgi:FkbM family methyltransferase